MRPLPKIVFIVLLTLGPALGPWPVAAQSAGIVPDPIQAAASAEQERISRWTKLKEAGRALPLATGLGTALAMRPRRKFMAPRSPAVVQTQIILAVIGALVMLVVGSSLARAFGVVGAAGLVRYRAKIEDPKEAGVMLSTLAVGLASGVGLYFLSAFAAAFIIAVLTIIERFEPEPFKSFTLKIDTKEAEKLQPAIETLLRRQGAAVELRTSSADELSFAVKMPSRKRTDAISKAILDLPGATAVDWGDEKKKSQTGN